MCARYVTVVSIVTLSVSDAIHSSTAVLVEEACNALPTSHRRVAVSNAADEIRVNSPYSLEWCRTPKPPALARSAPNRFSA